MQHEITVRLTDNEYAALLAETERTGQDLEDYIQTLLDEVLSTPGQMMRLRRKIGHLPSQGEVAELPFEEGFFASTPTGESLSPEEETELERLGRLFSQGKPLSEMIMEDRGPY